MKRVGRHAILRGALASLAVVTAGLVARADAPAGQYGPFNQANTVITDAKTNLAWQRTVTTRTDFAGAVAACRGLSLGTFPSGWRLPSYKELLTLVDESPHTEYPTGAPQQIAIDPYAFPETPVTPSNYWTSSVAGGQVFSVEFVQGNASLQSPTATQYVRCVHDPQ